MRLNKLLIWIGLTAGMASAQEPISLEDAALPPNPQVRIVTNLGGIVIELNRG